MLAEPTAAVTGNLACSFLLGKLLLDNCHGVPWSTEREDLPSPKFPTDLYYHFKDFLVLEPFIYWLYGVMGMGHHFSSF